MSRRMTQQEQECERNFQHYGGDNDLITLTPESYHELVAAKERVKVLEEENRRLREHCKDLEHDVDAMLAEVNRDE